MTSYLPFKVDGREIPADAPRSQGMSDEDAQRLREWAEEYRQVVMHLHADVVGREVSLTGANCPEGTVLFVFGDGTADAEERVDGGATPAVAHSYAQDGIYTAQLVHENRDRAFLEIRINTEEDA